MKIFQILNQLSLDLFMIVGWIVAMVGLFAFAVLGTLALEIMSVRLDLPPDQELAGVVMVALFVVGFICLNQLTGGAMYRVMGWSDDE